MALSTSLLRPLALVAGLAAAALPAAADQTDRIVFDVMLKGIRAGELAINGRIEGNRYGANGTLQTSGLVGMLRKLRYDATSSGAVSGARFTPFRYTEKANTPSRQSENVIVYKGGVPVSVSSNPPRAARERDVDPAAQGGTLDPLTALYAVLRDVDPTEACRLDVRMYDGARRSQVKLSAPKPMAGGGVTCTGEYRRLAGFSDKDMAERTRFPFTLVYEPTGEGRLQVARVVTATVYGNGVLKRR